MKYDDISYQIQRTDDKILIQLAVVTHLTRKRWFGYGKDIFRQGYVEKVLRPRVKKIARYIYYHKLCHVSFLKTVTQKELQNIIRGEYDSIPLPKM